MAHENHFPLHRIDDNPFLLRKVYNTKQIIALADNILEFGLVHPPTGRKVGNRIQIAAGHRRKRAFEHLSELGYSKFDMMPVLIQDLSDQQMFEFSASENIRREDFTVIEKAIAMKNYMQQFNATSEEAGRLFNMRGPSARGVVRLLQLPKETVNKIASGEISQHQAREILAARQKDRSEARNPTSADGSNLLREQLKALLFGSQSDDISDFDIVERVKALVAKVK